MFERRICAILLTFEVLIVQIFSRFDIPFGNNVRKLCIPGTSEPKLNSCYLYT